MQRIEHWLCNDCMIGAVNDDYTGLDYYLNESWMVGGPTITRGVPGRGAETLSP